MPDVWFTEADKMFRNQMRTFAQRELAPTAKERANLDYIPDEMLKKIGGLGITGIGIPEKYGGHPGSWVMLGIACEELGKADSTAPMLLVNRMVTFAAVSHGTEKVKQLLPSMIKLETMTTCCITEPGCGTDVSGIETRATRDGDHYTISGEKTSATFGMTADVAVIWATTNPAAGPKGISCFFIPSLDLPNIQKSLLPDMGCKPINRAAINFDAVRIPAANLLGQEGKGFVMLMQAFDINRPLAALAALGQAEISIEEAVEYAKLRHTFGKAISKYQAISFTLAENATMVDAAKLLSYRALAMADKGLPIPKEAAMSKWFSHEAAFKTIHDCLLVFGHIGYTSEFLMETRLRDMVGIEIADGALNVHKLIIAREMMGREFVF